MAEVIAEVQANPNQLVAITARAAREIMKTKEENGIPTSHALRLGVKGGGCSGMTYVLAFDEQPREDDTVYEMEGLTIFLDPKSHHYLSGTTLDFSDGLHGRGFVFSNPNASRTCGCGHSFGV
ncbi:MAG: iron-sulfur cluster assembly accessory protein [Ignavibacteria bacterium]|nr:iron-sulfur cluster assembly accessory protein [Ignavibacteria bacterium]